MLIEPPNHPPGAAKALKECSFCLFGRCLTGDVFPENLHVFRPHRVLLEHFVEPLIGSVPCNQAEKRWSRLTVTKEAPHNFSALPVVVTRDCLLNRRSHIG